MSTAKLVAKAANVALPTAYEALRGSGRMMPETRERVLRAAQKLNYKPSAAARAMNRRFTGQIGVVGKLHPVSVYFHVGANASVVDAGRVMSLLAYEGDDIDDKLQHRFFREQLFDGMIVVDQVPEALTPELDRMEHCVWANTNRFDAADCVRRDEFEVGRTAARWLVEAGWRDLVFVYGPLVNTHYSHPDRLRGIESVAGEAGTKVTVVACPEFGTPWEALDRRLDGYFGTSAFIFSDTYRIRAMQMCFMHRGLMPGRDVSVVCCDDIDDFRLVWPELSRVGFDRGELGRVAVQMLLDRIESGEPQPSRHLPFEAKPGRTIVPYPL